MDARNFVNIINADRDAHQRREWMELHRRPDASPLPPEIEVPWTQRVVALRWLFRAGAAARRRLPAGSGRGRPGEKVLSR